MRCTTLISVSDLAAHLTDAGWIVCDCRHDLVDVEAGGRAYARSHIPGARFLRLDVDLSGPRTGANGRHPLPDPRLFTARLEALGIGSDTQVVGYDASGGSYAARLWWLLRWVGHGAVAVLDGGWDAWVKAGNPVTKQLPVIKAAQFTMRRRTDVACDAGSIVANLGKPGSLLLDARSPDRFRGENETLDPVAGHIPGAANRFFKLNLDTDGRFKPAAVLRQEFSTALGAVPPAEVVHYCGSGVTACHNLLAMEIAGLTGSGLFPGSWSEWCANPSRPVARRSAEQPPRL